MGYNSFELVPQHEADSGIPMSSITKIPGIIEIDHDRLLAEEDTFKGCGQPWQRLLLDPDQGVSPRSKELLQSAPVRLDKGLRAATFAAIKSVKILVVQEGCGRHTETGPFQGRYIIVVTHATARPLSFVTAQ